MANTGKMLKNPRNPQSFSGCFMGCSCHNSKATRRKGKKAAKQAEKRAWRAETRELA